MRRSGEFRASTLHVHLTLDPPLPTCNGRIYCTTSYLPDLQTGIAKMAPAQPANEATLSQVGPSREQGQYAQVGEENWDEDQLEKAMNTLKEMHIQVRKSTSFLGFLETSLTILVIVTRSTNYDTENSGTFSYTAFIAYLPSCLLNHTKSRTDDMNSRSIVPGV